jgi:hypothetical protein
MLPFANTLVWFMAIHACGGALSLLLLLTFTEDVFFWTRTLPFNARVLGALNLSGARVVGNVARRGEREAAKVPETCQTPSLCLSTMRRTLFNNEALQMDHIEPRYQGGNDSYANLRLVHFYCHQQRHSRHKTAPHEVIPT